MILKNNLYTIEGQQSQEGTVSYDIRLHSDHFIYQAHFPGEPIVPGVILCEIMAQSCALLMKDDLIGKLTFYTGIDKVRFKNSVRPGDTVEVEATLTYHRANIYICSAVLSVGGKMCVKGELSFALLPDTRNK